MNCKCSGQAENAGNPRPDLGRVHGVTFLSGRVKVGQCLFQCETLLKWITGIRGHGVLERPGSRKAVGLLVAHALM